MDLVFTHDKGKLNGQVSGQLGSIPMSKIDFDGKNIRFRANFELSGKKIHIGGEGIIDANNIKGKMESVLTGKVFLQNKKEELNLDFEVARKAYIFVKNFDMIIATTI